jgi:hypothetical protein
MTSKGLSDYERGILMSGMSPGSAGMMLGRSTAWIERQRARLQALAVQGEAEVEVSPAITPTPEPAPQPEPVPEAKAPVVTPRPIARAVLPPKRTRARAEPRIERIEKVRSAPAVTRLKPVTARTLRWAPAFLDARWPLDEVAALFDVHPDALVDALERGVAA